MFDKLPQDWEKEEQLVAQCLTIRILMFSMDFGTRSLVQHRKEHPTSENVSLQNPNIRSKYQRSIGKIFRPVDTFVMINLISLKIKNQLGIIY